MNRRRIIQAAIALLAGAQLPLVQAKKQPQPRNLLLLHTPVAGFQFYQGEEVFSQIQPTQELTLKREKNNRHDSNAVAIYWQHHKLGYIPRTDNVAIAQIIDRGESLIVKAKKLKTSYNPWDRLEVEVYWVETV